jgi:hypothetical protein
MAALLQILFPISIRDRQISSNLNGGWASVATIVLARRNAWFVSEMRWNMRKHGHLRRYPEM